ncbi:MAG: response regulator transcription factor [Verrucomicrobia bacterium]|nr:response regulator transcription factor [Verrucomicrobiota bacterium]
MAIGKKRILVVEDEKAILLGLEENLKFAGYEVMACDDGARALAMALEHKPDMLLLDIMLPTMSGYDVCRKLRDSGAQMPIIMLTARQDEFDKLHGFEMGADDYVTKPFSVNELLARVNAVLARGRAREDGPREYSFGDCRLDLNARVLTRDEQDVPLTRTEFELLAYFCRNEGKALSRDVVMNDVWGTEYYGTQRSLDSFVSNLRSKLEVDPHNPDHIQTVHGVGYKFVL